MYKEVAKLILYRDLGEDSILRRLAGIFEDYENGVGTKAELTTRIYEQMKAGSLTLVFLFIFKKPFV